MQKSARRGGPGFTLIELMVVLAIVGILAAVAYPSYTSHVQRGRRADAVKLLTAVAQAQERYRGNRSIFASTLAELGLNDLDVGEHYSIDIAGVGTSPSLVNGYEVTATARSTSPQARDSRCAKLGIRVNGAAVTYIAADAAGNDTRAACWPR